MDSIEEKYTIYQKVLLEIANPSPEYFRGKGCSDGHCIVFKPSGMHTNGGCHCDRDDSKRMWVRMRLQKIIQDAKEALRES